MKWTKDGDGWICRVAPDDVFTLKVQPKADGRWTWEVFPRAREGARRSAAVATGIVSSLGAAKTVSENFAKRSGLV